MLKKRGLKEAHGSAEKQCHHVEHVFEGKIIHNFWEFEKLKARLFVAVEYGPRFKIDLKSHVTN